MDKTKAIILLVIAVVVVVAAVAVVCAQVANSQVNANGNTGLASQVGRGFGDMMGMMKGYFSSGSSQNGVDYGSRAGMCGN